MSTASFTVSIICMAGSVDAYTKYVLIIISYYMSVLAAAALHYSNLVFAAYNVF